MSYVLVTSLEQGSTNVFTSKAREALRVTRSLGCIYFFFLKNPLKM